MKKFRVLSDLHLDINVKFPFDVKDDVFTVICGDTSGTPAMSIKWIKDNINAGVGVSGNHLPYNRDDKTMQELREELAKAFPEDANFTYLDVETRCFKKVVDGILFLGTCFYSDMKLSSPMFEDRALGDNMRASYSHMNDWHWGIKEKTLPAGPDDTPSFRHIGPNDYVAWAKNALDAFDKALDENEKLEKPLPAVIVTHYPLVKEVVKGSFYVDEDNWQSYGNDMAEWLLSHPSVKCHCCGHCHDLKKDTRFFKIGNESGHQVLVVNNSRGYMKKAHDMTFNPQTFVNVETWEVEQVPETDEVKKEKEKRYDMSMALQACFF